jgi:SPP1 family holin
MFIIIIWCLCKAAARADEVLGYKRKQYHQEINDLEKQLYQLNQKMRPNYYILKEVFMEKFKIKIGTIIRVILQLLAYANQLIALLGSTSFASSPVYQWISFGITVAITLLTFWKDNDFTKSAIMMSEIFKALKDGKLSEEEKNQLIKLCDKLKEENKNGGK